MPSDVRVGLFQGVDLPGLRCSALKRYPHLVFYIERDDYIDVWRILHEATHIASWLRESGDAPR